MLLTGLLLSLTLLSQTSSAAEICRIDSVECYGGTRLCGAIKYATFCNNGFGNQVCYQFLASCGQMGCAAKLAELIQSGICLY
jgi:hypothetical protein